MGFLKKAGKLVISLIIIAIVFSLVGRLISLAVKLIVIGAIGVGVYAVAKKLKLIKG